MVEFDIEKKSMQVKTTIGLMGFVLSLVLCARAGGVVSPGAFTTGTSVENLTNGVFDASLDDLGGESGAKYWAKDGAINTVVTNYTPTSPAYDYEAKGTTRNPLFDDEPIPSKGTPGTNNKYLSLDTDGTLYRNIQTNGTDPILVKDYPDVYADTLVKFSVGLESPGVTGAGTKTCDKVIVWLREAEDSNGQLTTNLVVTAGRYAGDFQTVVAQDFVATNVVAADTWARLTIRAIGDVTDTSSGKLGFGAPGYVIYIDGKPVVADESYDIGLETISSVRQLSPEARVLAQARCLFPSLARAGLDESATLSRFAFDGRGAVDDTSLSTVAPAFATPGNVFTLQWDAGVTGMKCIVSNELAVVTNTIDATVAPFLRDYALPPDVETWVVVTDVIYDTAHEFKPGQWTAKDCVLEGNVFVCGGEAANPMGTVASTRDIIEVGTGSGQYATFKAAKLAATGDVKTIVLGMDIDKTAGTLFIATGEDFILDLDGHTLRGPAGTYSATVVQTGGALQIIDSSEAKTGRVLPPEGCEMAVKSASSAKASPKIVLTAGAYDGLVSLMPVGAYKGTCIVEGGSYTNSLGVTDTFYLESYVTNAATYFALDAQDYWSVAATGAYIWSGKGEDAWWTNAENWRGGECPREKTDTVIFPRNAGEAWTVHFNLQAPPTDFWLDEDVAMSGTNDFTNVKLVSGEGCFVGTGTAVFTGRIPGQLTASSHGDADIRLGADWAGTVKVTGVTKATPLRNIMYWGTAYSKVEFNGVRGYVSDRASYALPYGLVLTDAGTTPAWLNETGYTGSTVSFPTLEGAGTFVSPLNTREILQVFQFNDVSRFTGGFNLGGKRLVLGEARAPATAKAGSFTFAEGVDVMSGLDWTGVNAYFGRTLAVLGKTGDTLMAYTGADVPEVGDVVVTLRDPTTGEITTNYLSAKRVPGRITIITREEWEEERSGGDIPVGYEFTIDFALTPGMTSAVITVEKPAPNCYYVLQHVTSLAQDWSTCNVLGWKHTAPGDKAVTFEVDTTGAPSGFYRVIVTGSAPNE